MDILKRWDNQKVDIFRWKKWIFLGWVENVDILNLNEQEKVDILHKNGKVQFWNFWNSEYLMELDFLRMSLVAQAH